MKPFVAKPVTRSEAQTAAETFGLSLEGLTRDQVSKAFRTRVRNVHPDTGAPSARAAAALLVAASTRTLLLRWLDGQPDAKCPLCQGRGFVPMGSFGTASCPKCGGE